MIVLFAAAICSDASGLDTHLRNDIQCFEFQHTQVPSLEDQIQLTMRAEVAESADTCSSHRKLGRVSVEMSTQTIQISQLSQIVQTESGWLQDAASLKAVGPGAEKISEDKPPRQRSQNLPTAFQDMLMLPRSKRYSGGEACEGDALESRAHAHGVHSGDAHSFGAAHSVPNALNPGQWQNAAKEGSEELVDVPAGGGSAERRASLCFSGEGRSGVAPVGDKWGGTGGVGGALPQSPLPAQGGGTGFNGHGVADRLGEGGGGTFDRGLGEEAVSGSDHLNSQPLRAPSLPFVGAHAHNGGGGEKDGGGGDVRLAGMMMECGRLQERHIQIERARAQVSVSVSFSVSLSVSGGGGKPF